MTAATMLLPPLGAATPQCQPSSPSPLLSVQSVPTASISGSRSQLEPTRTVNVNGPGSGVPSPSPTTPSSSTRLTSTSTLQPPPDPNSNPHPKRELTTSQIVSILLPTVVWPVHIGYEFDLDDDDECRFLLDCLTPDDDDDDDDGDYGDSRLDRALGSAGQGRSSVGDPGPSSARSRESMTPVEDEDVHMADVEDGVEPGHSLGVRSSPGSRKGKERESQSMSADEDTESTWPAAFRRRSAIPAHSTPRFAARRPIGGDSGEPSGSSDQSGGSRDSSASSRRTSRSAPKTFNCIENESRSSSFSPVDWTKTKSGQDVQVVKLSPKAKLLLNSGRRVSDSDVVPKSPDAQQSSPSAPAPAAISPSTSRQSIIPPQAMAPTRSYTLPPPPEGSIAALRQETQGLAYPNSYVYGEKEKGSADDERVEMVIGADAGERMLSPESQDSGEEDEQVQLQEPEPEPEQNVSGSVPEPVPEPEPDSQLERNETNDLVDMIPDTQPEEEDRNEDQDPQVQVQPTAILLASSTESSVSMTQTQSSITASMSTSTVDEDTTTSRPSASPDRTLVASAPLPAEPSQPSPPQASPLPSALSPSLTPDVPEVRTPQKKADIPLPASGSQSTSTTTEDEEQVQTLVLDIMTPATSPVKPSPVAAAEDTSADADLSLDTVRGDDEDQRRSPTQEAPTPQVTTAALPADDSTSQPVLPAPSLPSIEVETHHDAPEEMDVDQELQEDDSTLPEFEVAPKVADPDHEHEPTEPEPRASSPMFTSPPKPPYSDVSWHTEDLDLGSTPAKLPTSEGHVREMSLEDLMHVDELDTPTRPVANEDNVKDRDNESLRIPKSPPPPEPSSVVVPANEPQKSKSASPNTEPAEIITISSDEEVEIVAASQPKPRPRKKAKIQIFDEKEVKKEPEVIDITTPDRPASPARRPRNPSPALPLTPLDQPRPDSVLERAMSPLTPLPSQYISVTAHVATDSNARTPDATTGPETPFDPQKHAAQLDDEDGDVIRVKPRKRLPSNADSVATTGTVPAAPAPESTNGDVKMEPAAAEAAKPPEPKTLLGGLLANKNKKKSVAVTRIKKRKRTEEDSAAGTPEVEDDYNKPPLKKAKLRTAEGGKDKAISKTKESNQKQKEASAKVKAIERISDADTPKRYPLRSPRTKVENITPAKTPTRRPRGQGKQEVKWPNVAKPNFDKYVSCDECNHWYHIGCVGIEPDAICLQPNEIYICPLCKVKDKDKSPAKNGKQNDCNRPDCLLKKKKKKTQAVVPQDDNMFEVESFVGRNKRFVGGQGTKEEYLVKWQGYGYHECTWEPLESMCLADPGPLLHAFEQAAKAQGINLNDTKEVIIFKEATAAGWAGYRNFKPVKRE